VLVLLILTLLSSIKPRNGVSSQLNSLLAFLFFLISFWRLFKRSKKAFSLFSSFYREVSYISSLLTSACNTLLPLITTTFIVSSFSYAHFTQSIKTSIFFCILWKSFSNYKLLTQRSLILFLRP
jgi:hypothetical protein